SMSTHYDTYADLRRPESTPAPSWDLEPSDWGKPPTPPKPQGDRRLIWIVGAAIVLVAAVAGVAAYYFLLSKAPDEQKEEQPPPPAPKRTRLKDHIFLEVQGTQRRVIIVSNVCLREGQLEGLLCRTGTKGHEYILETPVDARDIHAALLAANAKPGTPVQF